MNLAVAAALPSVTPRTGVVLPRSSRRHCPRGVVPRAASSSVSSFTSPSAAAAPIYTPTPQDRSLRTPHSGYHFDGTARPFFEGWYFKVSIPECRQSFCFMYSVENPLFRDGMSDLDKLLYRPRFTGVGAQILGADDKYICQFSEKSNNFWGSRHELMLGNTFISNKESTPPQGEVPPQDFSRRVLEGFQVTPIWHQGFIRDDGRHVISHLINYNGRHQGQTTCQMSKQLAGSTALVQFMGGVMSNLSSCPQLVGLQLFLSLNLIGKFAWLVACPQIQCNVFPGASGEVSLTAAGGLRKIGLGDTYESPSLIGIHYEGQFFEFVPWTGTVSWDIGLWGLWKMSGENKTHLVEIEATTAESGTALRAPTIEAGLVPACKDTCYGDLRLQLWEKKYDGSKGEMILDATSNMAALEVGGGPWFNGWKGTTVVNEVVNNIVGTPVDVESLLPIPFLKPPGL
ncbi:putative tocopherol cyclase, chloroplastic [Zea mays]|uniref:Putative tocopherol cyclase, chloroplastic n=1 Tax=Zea mays TaxID=4577 RepID=A0A1D6H4V5_MAIZE|nr:putative tocopherol cyclase, chloroplastic [Zea mays]